MIRGDYGEISISEKTGENGRNAKSFSGAFIFFWRISPAPKKSMADNRHYVNFRLVLGEFYFRLGPVIRDYPGTGNRIFGDGWMENDGWRESDFPEMPKTRKREKGISGLLS